MDTPARAYRNPVWSGYLADPFVHRVGEYYYAYGTGSDVGNGRQDDGRVFPVLRSRDLADWTLLGGALEPLPASTSAAYWAPEIAERDGVFYLYYAADMRLRVATADNPAGPFRDSGRDLFPDEPSRSTPAHFAIHATGGGTCFSRRIFSTAASAPGPPSFRSATI
jgi:beta-xylosidase